jgi:DNA replication and repair protein RecF
VRVEPIVRATALLDGRPAVRHQPPGFGVRRLTLTDFRCYAALRLEVEAPIVVLTGPNGAGKTNILEAISLLAPGRGLRRARLTDLTRRGGRAWAVAAEVSAPAASSSIGTGLEPPSEGKRERRTVRIEGRAASGASALAQAFAVGWLTPQMDRLFIEDAAGRRRFFDRLVYAFDSLHARRLAAYDRALRERTRLLRSGVTGEAWLAALEQTIVEHGVAIAAARRDALSRLERGLAQSRGPFPGAALALSGSVEGWLAAMAAVDAEAAWRARLRDDRLRDREAGGAAVGPHRSDLLVFHLGHGLPAAQCSTGEQKALLVAVVLAHARQAAHHVGGAPTLLLDEVAAHLDAERRAALFQELRSLSGQIWLTGTDADVFSDLTAEAEFIAVREGRAWRG